MRYLVFGRKGYPQPLEAQGTLDAPDLGSARWEAARRFGGGWVELVLIPLDQVHWVLPPRGAAGEEERVESRVG